MHLPTFLTIVLMALVALHQTTTDTRVAGHHWGRRGTEQISEGATTGNVRHSSQRALLGLGLTN